MPTSLEKSGSIAVFRHHLSFSGGWSRFGAVKCRDLQFNLKSLRHWIIKIIISAFNSSKTTSASRKRDVFHHPCVVGTVVWIIIVVITSELMGNQAPSIFWANMKPSSDIRDEDIISVELYVQGPRDQKWRENILVTVSHNSHNSPTFAQQQHPLSSPSPVWHRFHRQRS